MKQNFKSTKFVNILNKMVYCADGRFAHLVERLLTNDRFDPGHKLDKLNLCGKSTES